METVLAELNALTRTFTVGEWEQYFLAMAEEARRGKPVEAIHYRLYHTLKGKPARRHFRHGLVNAMRGLSEQGRDCLFDEVQSQALEILLSLSLKLLGDREMPANVERACGALCHGLFLLAFGRGELDPIPPFLGGTLVTAAAAFPNDLARENFEGLMQHPTAAVATRAFLVLIRLAGLPAVHQHFVTFVRADLRFREHALPSFFQTYAQFPDIQKAIRAALPQLKPGEQAVVMGHARAAGIDLES